MTKLFHKALGAGLVTVAALAQPAEAKDRPKPPPPCPLTAPLRVADEASLAGIQSLADCSNIIIAPATAAEVPPAPEIRIAPPAESRGRSGASVFLTSSGSLRDESKIAASRKFAEKIPASGPMRIAAIAPVAEEPPAPAEEAAAIAGTLPAIEAESILAMRPMSYTTQYDAMISRVAARHRIDPLLLHAVIDQESRYQRTATSHAGARGLMQLMPGTASMLNVRGAAIVDAEANVDGGARLLRQLHGRFNDFTLTLAAYNAGEGAVRKYGNKVPPYRETQDYVRQVMARYNKLVAEQAVGTR
ncbi:lytic transglycosylase domain-containing protein [Allosphingosinicella deserti]|uniref:Transglycosylase SLT domain-containing protein n=1 Tax=Allosphingosinicella deserti TaxID=2116704 RepID=A0A2P7QZX1_9SPHN|nr:lytic transglycosylase domain-containing protein [Sphingomonas deserti]PSJ43493.1 hypothetical protein C7I55_03825 [Sphingomonas deserti]